jgi:hypothetical protein
MQRIAIGFGIDGDGLDAHLAGGLDDPAGDLAAIGDQNFLNMSCLTCNLEAGSERWGRRYNVAWRRSRNNSVADKN